MKFIATVLLIALMSSAVLAQTEVKFEIDEFVADSFLLIQTQGAVTPADGNTQTAFADDATILGGSRDVSLTLSNSIGIAVMTSNVINGEWATSVSTESSGLSFLQYDGVDQDIALDVTGLAGEDFTANLGSELFITIAADLDATFVVSIYDTTGAECSIDIDVPGTAEDNDFSFLFTQFSGDCDFTDVGAVELHADASLNIDSTVSFFAVRGDIPVSASPTPSTSPSSSASPSQSPAPPSETRTRTPTPAPTPPPTVSRTPTPTPSPIVAVCDCNCPTFFCGLVYAVPRDDDDGIDDEWFDDDNDVVYRPVYYKPADDDFIDRVGTDDQDNITFMGGLTRNNNDDDDEQSSGAATMVASVVLASAALMLLA